MSGDMHTGGTTGSITMRHDAIVEEVRGARKRLFRRCHNNLGELVKFLAERERPVAIVATKLAAGARAKRGRAKVTRRKSTAAQV